MGFLPQRGLKFWKTPLKIPSMYRAHLHTFANWWVASYLTMCLVIMCIGETWWIVYLVKFGEHVYLMIFVILMILVHLMILIGDVYFGESMKYELYGFDFGDFFDDDGLFAYTLKWWFAIVEWIRQEST